MSVVIGGYTATNPTTSYSLAIKPIGASRRALSGALVTFYSATKSIWSVKWSGLTSTIRDLIMAELDTQAIIAWTDVDGTETFVRVNSAKWSPTPSGESSYDVEAELEEQ